MKNILKKVMLIIYITLAIILINTNYSLGAGLPWIFSGNGSGYFCTTTGPYEGDIFCKEHGGKLNSRTLLAGLSEGDIDPAEGEWCDECNKYEHDYPQVHNGDYDVNNDYESSSGGSSGGGSSINRPTVEVNGINQDLLQIGTIVKGTPWLPDGIPDPPTPPPTEDIFHREAYTCEYETREYINFKEWQEVSYILTFIEDRELAQSAIWLTDFNIGSKSCNAAHAELAQIIATEAKEYKKYYEALQSNGFTYADKTDYSSVKTSVNADKDTYIIGKFSIEYLEHFTNSEIEGVCIEHWEDQKDQTQKFGYIYDMKVRDQNGNELTIVDIISADGESILSRENYKYPHSLEEFYVEFEYDDTGAATDVYLDIEFKYLKECQAEMYKLNGHKYKWYWEIQTTTDKHHEVCYDPCPGCDAETDEDGDHDSHNIHDTDECEDAYYFELIKEENGEIQELFEVMYKEYNWLGYRANPIWEKVPLTTGTIIPITMDIEGMVFLDIPNQKQTVKVNGCYDEEDKLMADIEVILHESSSGAILGTLTDSNGHFSFKRLDAQREYYITYKFNGQKYENTAYKEGEWSVSSKASILDDDRLEYNEKFKEIHSSPNNYTAVNRDTGLGIKTNKVYKIYEQTYSNGQREYEDIERLQEAINSKLRGMSGSGYPMTTDAKKEIYRQVVNENRDIDEVERKIQYIVDMEVIAHTGYKSSIDYYPIYSKFTIDTVSRTIKGVPYPAIYPGQKEIHLGLMEREKLDLILQKDLEEVTIYINNKRYVYEYRSGDESDRLNLKIRGTDIVDSVNESNLYERNLRESDISYIKYLQDRPTQDYSKRLRIFVTYKIRVRNETNGQITTNITELRDHFDDCYTFDNGVNSSVVIEYESESGMTVQNSRPTVQETSENVYQLVKTENRGKDLAWSGTTQGTPNNTITTNAEAMSDIGLKTGEFFDIYNMFEVKTDSIKDLLNTEEATKENYAQIAAYKSYYTYDRYYCNDDEITPEGYVAGLVDRDARAGDFDANSGDVTIFVNNSYLPQYINKKGEQKTQESLNIFEDDADKAPGIKLKVLTEYRFLRGNVWEDKIVKEALEENNIRRGDGENNDSQPIKNLRVQLIDMDRDASVEGNGTIYSNYNTVTDIYSMNDTKERLNDGYFSPATTLTDENGNYEFKGYIPGNYLVRFIYGEQELLKIHSVNDKKVNDGKVYEGQDYKSTLYTEADHQYIKLNENEVEEPRYWYEETKSQFKSDAQDNLIRRNEINGTNSTMNYHSASILNYYENQNYYNNKETEYLAELEGRTKLFADTEKLVLESEYVQRNSDYSKDKDNTLYVVEKVDFGLVERPRAELTITKDIENIRIIANTGQTLFDAEQQVSNLAWVKPIKNMAGNYDRNSDRNGMIQAIIDENLMHGATVKILYRITVENTGEQDYLEVDQSGNITGVHKTFYNRSNIDDYNNDGDGDVPPGAVLARTNAINIFDYVENNLKFSNELDEIDAPKEYNKNWEFIIGQESDGVKTDRLSTVLITEQDYKNSLINPDLEDTVKSYNTIIRATSTSPLLNPLLPANSRATHKNDNAKGQSVSDTLLLTKILDTSDSSTDSFVYDNGIEIVQTTNEVGRRHYNNIDKLIYEDDDQITKTQIISSIPGNYNPSTASDQTRAEGTVTSEPDSDYAERVAVMTSFGANKSIIIIVSSVIAVLILGVGIVLIKKKVLKK